MTLISFRKKHDPGYDTSALLLSDLRSQPETADLLDQIGRVQVIINDYLDGFEARSSDYGSLMPSIRIIKMSKERQRGAVLFELFNILNRDRFSFVDRRLCDYTTADEYARATEKIEFDGVVQTIKIEEQINRRQGMRWIDSGFSSFPRKVMDADDFETYYTCYLAPRHKDYYRREWCEAKRVPFSPQADPRIRKTIRLVMILGFIAVCLMKLKYRSTK